MADIILNWITYNVNAAFSLTIVAVTGIFIGTYFANKHAEELDKQK